MHTMRTSVERAVFELRRAATLRPPAVPDHVTLRPCDKPFWDALLRERAYDEWPDVLLPVVAQMAWLCAQIHHHQARLADEDSILRNPRTGARRRNPRATLVRDLTRLLLAMQRSLGIGAPPPRRKH